MGPEAAIVVNPTPAFTSSGIFGNYTATTPLTYYIRTSSGGSGGGNISLKVTSDFAPGGGPSVTTPPNAADLLTYANTVSSPGTAVTPTQTASTGTSTGVASFAAGVTSAKGGNSASVAWTLINDPVYAQGAYAATVTFTIAAT